MKWGCVRPGMMMAVPPADMDDEYSGKTYLVLSVDGEGGVVSVTVLLSTGVVTEWAGRRTDEYYEDVPLRATESKNPGE